MGNIYRSTPLDERMVDDWSPASLILDEGIVEDLLSKIRKAESIGELRLVKEMILEGDLEKEEQEEVDRIFTKQWRLLVGGSNGR